MNRLRNNELLQSKKFRTSLIALLVIALEVVFGVDIQDPTMTGILLPLIGLVTSYGIEDFIAALGQKVKRAPERLYESKRFWVTLASVLVVVGTTFLDDTRLTQDINFLGKQISVLTMIVIVTLSTLTGISLQDFGEAWKEKALG